MYEGNMFPITANKLNVKKQVNEMKYSLDMKKLEQTRSMSETKFQLIVDNNLGESIKEIIKKTQYSRIDRMKERVLPMPNYIQNIWCANEF